MTEFESRMIALLTDISESLAILSGRKKPYTPDFLDTFGFGDTAPEQQGGAGNARDPA